MSRPRLSVAAAALLTLCTAIAPAADQPATRPVEQAPTTRPASQDLDASPAEIRQSLRAMGISKAQPIHSYTKQEWDEMMAFLQINSPARFAVLHSLKLAPNSPLRFDLIRKWRNYNFVRDHFPAVADNYVKRFQLEDELFYLLLKARRGGEPASTEMHDRIRAKVAQLIDLGFDERQIRVAKLEELLNAEKKKLSDDQENKDAVIDQRTDAIMARLQRSDDQSHRPHPTTQPATDITAAPNPVPPVVDTRNSSGDQQNTPTPPVPVDGAP